MDRDPQRSYLSELKTRGPAANPFFQLMGIEVARLGEGEAALELAIRPEMHNGEGWLQGGLLVALADEAMALALYTALAEEERIATISESTSFLSGIRQGTIIASGRVLKRGRRVAFAEGAVQSEDGTLLARSSAVFSVRRPDAHATRRP